MPLKQDTKKGRELRFYFFFQFVSRTGPDHDRLPEPEEPTLSFLAPVKNHLVSNPSGYNVNSSFI